MAARSQPAPKGLIPRKSREVPGRRLLADNGDTQFSARILRGCSLRFIKALQDLQCCLDAIVRHEQRSTLYADTDTHNNCRDIDALQCDAGQFRFGLHQVGSDLLHDGRFRAPRGQRPQGRILAVCFLESQFGWRMTTSGRMPPTDQYGIEPDRKRYYSDLTSRYGGTTNSDPELTVPAR